MEKKYFDVDSALKDHSADQVATHMAQLFGIDRNAYLKDGKTDAEFLNEYKSKPLPSTETQTQTATPTSINEPSNALNVISGGAAAAIPAIGKYGVHKLGDVARNALGINPNAPAQPAPSVNVQKQFVSPEAVQQRIINSAKPARPAGPSDVVNWAMGKQEGAGQYGRGYLGGANMEQEALLHKQADALEAANPGRKIMPGTSNLLIPESEYNRIISERNAAQAKAHTEATANAADAAELRRQRLAKTQPTTGAKVAEGALNIANKPLLNRFTTGYNTADLLQAQNPFEATVSATGAIAPYVTPKIAKMVHPKYRGAVQAAGVAAQYGAPLVNMIERKLISNEPEEKAAGGLIQHFSAAGSVKNVAGGLQNIAKKFQKLPTKQVKVSEALEPHVGSYLGLTQSDNFGVHGNIPMGPPKAGETLYPSERMGGNKFSGFQRTNPAHQESNVVWMNDTEEHANDMVNRNTFNGKPVIWTTRLGTPNQLVSNKTVFNNVMDEFYKQKYTPEQYDILNDRIKFLADKGKFRGKFDIRDRFALQELGADTFHGRRALGDMIGEGIGVGKSKNGLMLPNYEDILKSHRDPATQGLGTNALGQRLFTVDNTPSQFNTSFHPDYRYTVHGTDQGVEFPFSSPDKLTPRFYNNYVAKNNQAPAGNGWFGYMNDPQEISPQLIEGLKKEGLAEGGSVPHLAGGGNPLEAFKKLGITDKMVEAWRAANKVAQRQPNSKILQQAAIDVGNGTITPEQYRALVREHLPIKPFTEVPPMPSQIDIASALKPDQVDTGIVGVNKAIVPGTKVSSRLDIPAYNAYDKWIVSLHNPEDAGRSMGYGQTAHLAGPIEFTAAPKAGHAIATGKTNKTTYARIHGDWQDTHPDEVYKRAQELMNNPEWAQIGNNPYRHSYFYDKADMSPVTGAEEVLQVGPLVLAKKPVKVSPDDPRFRLNPKDENSPTFKKGGLTALKKKK